MARHRCHDIPIPYLQAAKRDYTIFICEITGFLCFYLFHLRFCKPALPCVDAVHIHKDFSRSVHKARTITGRSKYFLKLGYIQIYKQHSCPFIIVCLAFQSQAAGNHRHGRSHAQFYSMRFHPINSALVTEHFFIFQFA